MSSVDFIVTEVDRLKDIIACLKGENAALKAELAQQSHNKPSMPVCPHAAIKWSVCSCNIVESVCPRMDECDGQGTYSVPGNSGFGYSYQCNKFPGKPAHVG